MKKPVFTGAAVAIITPMHADGSVNYAELDREIDFQLASGINAIVTCGTTGESAALSNPEHCRIMAHTIDRVNGRVPVIAGTGSNNTAYALELSKEAAQMGANALLLVSPYYNKTSQSGLVKHFNHIAERVDVPCILYNVPSRTGCNIKPETYLTLSQTPNIVAVKEAGGNLSAIAQTAALCGSNLTIYSGNDDQTIPVLALGGKGVVSVTSNICPREMVEITQLWFSGKIDESRALFLRWLDLMNALFYDVNPIPVKAAMNMMGLDVGPMRLPLCEMGEANVATLRRTLEEAGLL